MTIAVAQDGRAVDITLSNLNEDWVILATDVTIKFVERDRSSNCRTPEPGKPVPIEHYRCILDGTPNDIQLATYKGEIQPKSSASLYVEIGQGERVEMVSIGEVRGREATLLERTRAKLR